MEETCKDGSHGAMDSLKGCITGRESDWLAIVKKNIKVSILERQDKRVG